MQKSKKIVSITSGVMLLGAVGIATPIGTSAATPIINSSRAASAKLDYVSKEITLDPTQGAVSGLDLSDKGAALVSQGRASYVVQSTGVNQLQQVGTKQEAFSVQGEAINNRLKIVGTGTDPALNWTQNKVYVRWASPVSSFEASCTSGHCPTDYQTMVRREWLNNRGYALISFESHGGPSSTLIDPSGIGVSVPSGVGIGFTTGLSDGNDISGWANRPSSSSASAKGGVQAYVARGQHVVWLPAPGRPESSEADAISSSGNWIAGRMMVAGGGGSSSAKVLLWNQRRKATVLNGAPAGFSPVAVNNSGWMVGEADDGSYLLRDGRAYALNDVVTLPHGSKICEARDINNSGQILVNTCAADNSREGALILTPRR